MTGRDSAAARDRVLLQLERASPRLPGTSLSVPSRLMVAALVHAAIGALLVLLPASPLSTNDATSAGPDTRTRAPRMVFVAPSKVLPSGGGGGGGNRVSGPIPRAQAPGSDVLTLSPTRAVHAAPIEPDLLPPIQEVALDAKVIASGIAFLAGLPDAGPPVDSDARGPGRGTGFGEGEGSGVGSGIGPGAGPGTGGGAGGGTYRVGGAVSAPTVLTQVRPTYTEEALSNRIQGSVELELIVRQNGMPDAVRVVRSLDRGGLDVEAVRAVRQWRFRAGRIDDTPVDVLVTVIVNFSLH